MDSQVSSAALVGLVTTVAWLLSLGGYAATIATIAFVVRRHRPDAYVPLLVWAIGTLVFSLISAGATWVWQMLIADRGVEAVLNAQLIVTTASMPFHLLLLVVFLRGLVKLAQPPKAPVLDGAAPYR